MAIEMLQTEFDRLSAVGAPAARYLQAWEIFKDCIITEMRGAAKSALALVNRSYKLKIARLRRRLRSPGLTRDTIAGVERDLTAVVAQWHGLKQRRRYARATSSGSQATKEVCARAALPRTAQTIVELHQTDGAPVRARTDLSNRMADGWQETFTQPERPPCPDLYKTHATPRLVDSEARSLGSPFTLSEVQASIRRCKKSKSGGPDMLPNAWYRDFADLLAPVLHTLLNVCFEHGITPQTFQQATIVCLPKAGRSKDPLGYRPISLLNTDYKIYMRLLTTRLKPLLPTMIVPSQGGFVPGRDIHDVIDLFFGAQKTAINLQADTIAVLLDIKKAYDSLDRRFLLECLEQRGFPRTFIRAIEATHSNTTARFSVNGVLSRPLTMTRGIRQGCPLAPMLFIIAMDPLYRNIAADPRLAEPFPQLPDLLPPCAGYADDTALYIQDESKLGDVVHHLSAFAAASGLQVNKAKSVVIRLNPLSRALENTCGFTALADTELCRYLGAQVGRRIELPAVWALTSQQIERKLAMASVKTHSVSQRVLLASTIIMPKIAFIARHHWPDAATVTELDARVRNFVWTGLFQVKIGPGAGTHRWMSKDLADLHRRDGGLGSPNVALELHTLAAMVVAKWCYEPTGLRHAAARMLSLDGAFVQAELSLTVESRRPSLMRDLWSTGRSALGWIYGTTIQYPVQLLIRDAIAALNLGADWRWFRGRFERDYGSFMQIGGFEIDRLRKTADGALTESWVQHMAISAKGSAILHLDGTTLTTRHLKALGEGTRVADFVTWAWIGGRTLSFTPAVFPLTNAQAPVFRLLCDTLVANFPMITRTPDCPGLCRTYNIPPTVDVEFYRIEDTVQRMTDGLPGTREHAVTQRDMQTLRPVVLDGVQITPVFECTPDRTMLVRPWRGAKPWEPKRRHLKRALGAPGRARGHTARAARAARWADEDEDIATALALVPWHELVATTGLTTYESQLWLRVRHHQLRVWDSLGGRGVCARHGCEDGQAAVPHHIVWSCPRAQRLWRRVADQWGVRSISDLELLEAVFARRAPTTTYDWRALFPERETVVSDRLEYWLQIAWVQLITTAIQRLWTRTVATARGERDDDGEGDFYAVLTSWTGKLRGDIAVAHASKTDTRRLDARILRVLYKGLAVQTELPTRREDTGAAFLLFFDGGSRGNPGPGGSGAVIVKLDPTPEVAWAASMSYASKATTNNYAEYQGLCAGLAAAEAKQWRPLEVVGDSMMIIRQMITRRKPKAAALRPLFEKARSAADALRVRSWHHHYRERNKMADKAANQAMDSGASYQAGAESGRPELGELRDWLSNDVSQWLQRDLSRLPDAGD